MTSVIGRAAQKRDAAPMTCPAPGQPDFNQSPFLVIWEATRACALACVHCRADAIARRDPRELTTPEACQLIDQVRAFGMPPPLFVLTGGDPMRRPDLADLVRYATDAGLTVALTPSGTAAATPARLAELKTAGLSRVAVSLDGPTPEIHDAFRRVRGSYAWTMRIIDAAIELGLPLQINSTISALTLPHLDAMAARVAELPVTLWALFFLIQTGRGASLEQISSDDCERVLQADLFRRLREPNALLGKCGRCAFRGICGGSRSRAFASTGAVMASDPLCAYDPGPNVEPLIAEL